MAMTNAQYIKMLECMGNGTTFPKASADPVVNYYVDMNTAIADGDAVEYSTWEDLPDDEKEIYIKEAKLFSEM